MGPGEELSNGFDSELRPMFEESGIDSGLVVGDGTDVGPMVGGGMGSVPMLGGGTDLGPMVGDGMDSVPMVGDGTDLGPMVGGGMGSAEIEGFEEGRFGRKRGSAYVGLAYLSAMVVVVGGFDGGLVWRERFLCVLLVQLVVLVEDVCQEEMTALGEREEKGQECEQVVLALL